MDEKERRKGRDQGDVLPAKGNVTQGAQGLQQWGDEATPEGARGAGGSGTAARAARIGAGQLARLARERRTRN